MPLTRSLLLVLVWATTSAPARGPSGAAAALVASAPSTVFARPATRPTSEQSSQQGIALDNMGHDRGAAMASNWVVEFMDLGCSYCAKFALETFPVLDREYVSNGKVRWKFIPFVIGMFPNSEEAAVAVECAAEQGKFLQMHDSLYAERTAWMHSTEPKRELLKIAKGAGVNVPLFTKCSASDAPLKRVREASLMAKRLNIRGTPTFFINGQRVEGAIPLPLFRQVMERLTATPAAK